MRERARARASSAAACAAIRRQRSTSSRWIARARSADGSPCISSSAQPRLTAVGRDARRTRSAVAEILSACRCEGKPVRGGDPDRGRAAHDHRPDRVRDLGSRAAVDLDLLAREQALVEEDDAVILEAQDPLRLEHGRSLRRRGVTSRHARRDIGPSAQPERPPQAADRRVGRRPAALRERSYRPEAGRSARSLRGTWKKTARIRLSMPQGTWLGSAAPRSRAPDGAGPPPRPPRTIGGADRSGEPDRETTRPHDPLPDRVGPPPGGTPHRTPVSADPRPQAASGRAERPRATAPCAPLSYVPSSQEARYLACSSVSCVDRDAHRRQLEPGDLLVDLARHRVDLTLERRGVRDGVLGRERLVREGHVHHDRRVALGGRDVDEAAFGEQVERAAVGERELLDEPPRLARLDGERSAAPGCRSRR